MHEMHISRFRSRSSLSMRIKLKSQLSPLHKQGKWHWLKMNNLFKEPGRSGFYWILYAQYLV